MEKILSFEDVGLNYHTKINETAALKNMSFEVEKEQFVSIVGPSGCGKTTILSLIAGLLKPSCGKIEVCGQPIKKKYNQNVGYMFQRDNLFDWLNVFQNVCLGLSIQHKKTPENLARAKELLNKYGLGEFEKHYPSQLSGGMRQRVALIRTLATNPDILLLDEPFSAVDFQTRLLVQDDIYKIIKNEKKTAILVTHDISEATSMSDRVVILTKRPAHVKCDLKMEFDPKLLPFERRSDPNFSKFFNKIWEELKSEENEENVFVGT